MYSQETEPEAAGGYIAYCRDAGAAADLEAQRRAVMGGLLAGDGRQRLLAVYVEAARRRLPELRAALAHAAEAGATLLIAEAGPLAGKAAFLGPLLDSGIGFLACDMPEVTQDEWRLRRDFAEEARLAMSARTRTGLAEARARGVRLGTAGAERARENRARAAAEAEALRPLLEALAGEGITSVRRVAAALNDRGIATPRGGRWHPTSAARLLRRLGGLTAGGRSISGLWAGGQPPKPPAEPPEEKIIRIPPDKIRPPEQGPPKPERGPEIRIPPERIKTPEDHIKIPPGAPPDIAPPPAPEDRAKDSDD